MPAVYDDGGAMVQDDKVQPFKVVVVKVEGFKVKLFYEGSGD